MQSPQLKMCTDCSALQNLYAQIYCSIYQLMKNKWIGNVYNVDKYFDADRLKTLLNLKRIVYKRLFNPSYPSSYYSNQDIVSLVSRILYKQNDCPECPCEIFEDTTTTSSTTTVLP